MQFFRISYSDDSNVIGATFPQSQKANHPVSVDDTLHLWNHSIGMSFRDAILPELIMHPKAKLTDLISSATTGARLVFSQKLKDLLDSSINISMGELRPIKVLHKKQVALYWIFNPIKYQVDLIDFDRSKIWLLKSGVEVQQQFFINSRDFLDKVGNIHYPEQILIKKLYINELANKDFFTLNYLNDGLGYFVSESLKDKIQNVGCTGIEFT